MIYSLLRAIGRVALRWYYSDVTVVGAERISRDRPLLVAVNHPNALVDVLLAGATVRRRLLFTAKATLFENPAGSLFLSSLGVLPLRRVSDEGDKVVADPTRNAAAFRAVAEALAKKQAVLIFPEGRSHDDPRLAPLRTGAARMALHARDDLGVSGIQVLPIGLVFERKERPRTRVLVVVGQPIEVDAIADTGGQAVATLTERISQTLLGLTLNHDSIGDAERAWRVSELITRLLNLRAPDLSSPPTLRDQVAVLREVDRIRPALPMTDAAKLEQDLESFDRRLSSLGLDLDDFTIETNVTSGSRFVVRESMILLVAGPLWLWGWLNHVIPFRLALIAGRKSRESNADPAMRTIIAGTALVLAVYAMQAAAVAFVFGPWFSLAYVVSLPVAADINLRLSDRLRRARRRAKAYLLLRRKTGDRDALRQAAMALQQRLLDIANEQPSA